jgi:shikimate kinase
VQELVVIAGPIGSGKTSVADLLARRCASASRSVAVADLDDVALTQRGARDIPEFWRRAGVAHTALVRGWFDSGIDVVIAHGPFFESCSYDTLFASTRADSRTHHVLLKVPFDIALQRVTADPERGPSALSKDPDFLRSTHDAFAELDLPPADYTFDTFKLTPTEIVDRLVTAFLESSAAAQARDGQE